MDETRKRRFTVKLKAWICALLIALFALPVLAQDSASHTVAFDGFSFNFPASLATGVSITQYPGDPDHARPTGRS